MDAIRGQIRDLFAKADEEGRKKIQEELRELQTSLDTEWDMLVRVSSGFMQMALVKIGIDLRIFETLANSAEPVTLDQLAEKSGAAPTLLGHILRAQASFGLIKETGKDEFTTNRMAKAFTDINVAGAVEHAYDVHGVVAHALPAWLKENKYQNITSNKNLAFHKAFNTDLTPFEWMKQHPEQMKSLGHAMAIQREGHWVDSYPVEKEVGSFSPASDSALLVDIGGGFGQQSAIFKNKFPNLKGRVIVEDIPETLDNAPPVEGIEFKIQDFFKTQEVKGAKFYYLRHILHDWTDEDCIKILKAIVPVMGPESRIVIDEIVLPNSNVPWQAAYMDLTMMSALGGVERTKAEFEKLLAGAGLRMVDIHKYDPKLQSVILAVPK